MAINVLPFNYGTWYNQGDAGTQGLVLADAPFRQLILTKALANITPTTIPALNALLSQLFAGRGRCYVQDYGGMKMAYTFEFALQPYELAILTQSGATPRPAGVKLYINQVRSSFFGFAGGGTGARPFNYGTFAPGVVDAT